MKYKDVSHIPIEKIKQQQAKYKRDIIQPRIEGEVNPEYVHFYGAKKLNVSKHDVERMAKIDHRLANKLLDNKRKINVNSNI